MVGMIVFRRVGQHERRLETAINLNQLCPLRSIIGQLAVRMAARKKFRAQQTRRGAHFLPTHRRQIPHRLLRLSFVALTQNTSRDGRAVGPGARQCAGAQEFGVVGMSHDGEDALVFEAEFHAVRITKLKIRIKIKIRIKRIVLCLFLILILLLILLSISAPSPQLNIRRSRHEIRNRHHCVRMRPEQ